MKEALEQALIAIFDAGTGCVVEHNSIDVCQLDVVGVRSPDTLPDVFRVSRSGTETHVGGSSVSHSGTVDSTTTFTEPHAEHAEGPSAFGVVYSPATDVEFESQPEPVWVERDAVRFAIQVHHRRWGEGVQSLVVGVPLAAARASGEAVFREVCSKLVLDPPDCGKLTDAVVMRALRRG